MSNVKQMLEERRRMLDMDEAVQEVRQTISARVDGHVVFALDMVAKEFQSSRSSMASELIMAALTDALEDLEMSWDEVIKQYMESIKDKA